MPKTSLPLNELCSIWDNFRSLRSFMPQTKTRVFLAGGEPLLSEHLFTILDLIRKEGFQSRLLTNGTLIDHKMALELKRSDCNIVQISIDGDKKRHDEIRGHGSFQRAVDGARLLREVGIQVTMAMTLTQQNVGQIESFLDIAKAHADRAFFHRFVPLGEGKKLRPSVLASGELQKAFTKIYEYKSRHPQLEVPLRDPLWKPFLRCRNSACYIDGCSAGLGGICIESNGEVYPCRRMPIVLGNALKDPLIDIWHSQLMERLRDRKLLKGRCGQCPIRGRCGGCRAVAFAKSGDALAEDPQCFYEFGFAERLLGRAQLALSTKFAELTEGSGG